MKFSLLAVGQQFEYQGEPYIKSTPLIAHHVDTGEQRLIPRSATVIANPSARQQERPADRRNVNSEVLQQAFAEFEAQLQQELLADPERARQFAEAKQRFFGSLGIRPAEE